MTSPHAWISDRTPTRDDADVNNFVEVRRTPNGKQGIQVHWQTVVTGQQWRFNKHWQKSLAVKTAPIAQTIQTCSACRYWKKWSKPGGECRRNAPQSVMIHADMDYTEHIAYWPGTDDADWCGEWEARQ